MKNLTLHLKNFCHHRELDVEFPVGITGIVGPNGSGKSSIVQALKFAICGESGNAGTKLDDLNWEPGAADEGGAVEWTFEKDGETGILKRAIHRAAASLKWGEVKERSISKVNAAIMEIVGVPQKTLEDIVFVMQGRIERVLFDRPAERKRNFHALFGIDKAESVRELLRKELAMIGVDPSDERIEELERRLKIEVDPQLTDLVAKQQAIDMQMKQVDRGGFQRIVTQYEEVQQLSQQVASITTQVDVLAAEVGTLSGQHQEAVACLGTAESELATRRAEVDNLRVKVAGIDSAKKMHDTIVQLQKDQMLASDATHRLEPTPPATGLDAIALADKQLIEARADVAPKQAFIAAFEHNDADVVACPTCGQSVENAAEKATRMHAEIVIQLSKIGAVDAALKQARADLQTYERVKQRHDDAVEGGRRALKEIGEKLATLGADEYTADADVLAQQSRETIVEFERAEKEQARLIALAPQFEVSIAAKRGQLGTLQQQLTELQAKLTEAPDEQRYQTAVQTITDIDEMTEERANTAGQITQLQQHRASTLSELEALKQKASSMAATKQYQELCERTRSLFHHDCLPQVTTQAYLGSLNAHLNKYLQTFQVPFACTINDDLSVACIIPGVGEKPAARLSGGQKVVLSIAFRFAIYDMFAADLGFMVLDEPTSMLDDDRISNIVEVLETVRRHAHNTGMQLVVITHEPELKRSFDHTIQL